MKIKIDENVPAGLADILERLGQDVHTVQSEGLSGADDGTVWQAAQHEGRFLITQDMDFSDLRRFMPGRHAGILLLRLREPSRRTLLQKVETLFSSEDTDAWRSCFVVATESKTRVRRG